jgi:hypothetical protein
VEKFSYLLLQLIDLRYLTGNYSLVNHVFSTSYTHDDVMENFLNQGNKYYLQKSSYLSILGMISTRNGDALHIAKAMCNAKAGFPSK